MSFQGLLMASNNVNSGGGPRDVADFLPPPSQPNASSLSLSIRSNMESHGDMGLIGESLDSRGLVRLRDDEYESRSGSDNLDGASGDDQDGDQPRRKKKYHRHTPLQIQELEGFFKDCPHPDEKQRMELSRRLGLECRQIKFWFQNRRTQMKTQLERHENILLRQENDKLRAENTMMKNAMNNPTCSNCGGPAVLGEITYEEHQLRIENARLKDELNRITTLSSKFLGRPVSSYGGSMALPAPTSALELGVGRNGFGSLSSVGNTLPMGLDLGDGISSGAPSMSIVPSGMGMSANEINIDRDSIVELALTAMNELMKMAQPDSPFWSRDIGGNETLNLEEYMRTAPSCFRVKPNGLVTEASRETGMVIINSLALVETMMDVSRWIEMFPCLVARASTIDLISGGIGGSRNDCLQLMDAEFQVLSPLVPVRPVRFVRYCKQQAEGVWAVVDVSINASQEGSSTQAFVNCRRLASGCVVQDMPNGYSKVTWVEHSEYDESLVHHLYRPLLGSGMGFGAQRWIATLQRQCECLAILMSSTIPGEDPTAISPGGRRSMLKLAQRMTNNFCSGVCASSVRKWDKLHVGSVGEDVRVMTRKSMDDPGEPPGIVLSAATSVWMPVSRQQLFNFLRNEHMRSEWDILSNGGPIAEMVHIAKGQGYGNCVSLLRAGAVSAGENNMLILQETWTDASASLVVYAPVDVSSMNVVMNGGDSAYVALLPSGFAILPFISSDQGGHKNCNGAMVKEEDVNKESNGCLLTVGFQILVNNLPTAKLTVESVETVNNLISCTIQKIKAALQVA